MNWGHENKNDFNHIHTRKTKRKKLSKTPHKLLFSCPQL